jgi:hypothetical protein
MLALQERTAAVKETIALAIDAYHATVNEASNAEGGKVNWNLLYSAIPTLRKELLTVLPESETDRILDRLYEEEEAAGL